MGFTQPLIRILQRGSDSGFMSALILVLNMVLLKGCIRYYKGNYTKFSKGSHRGSTSGGWQEEGALQGFLSASLGFFNGSRIRALS